MNFQFRPMLAAVTAAGLAVLIGLGLWQLQRLEWKRDLIARTQARLASAPIPFDEALARAEGGEDMEYQPVRIAGVYAHDLQSFVFGTYEGAAGAYVFTPLESPAASGKFVYINRGFVPQSLRGRRHEGAGVGGENEVSGLFRSAERRTGLARLFRPVDQPEDNLYFIRDPEVLAARNAIVAPAYYLDSFGRENPGERPKGGTTRVEFSNRHLEYALTWFALAAALAGVYAAFSLQRP